MIQDKTPIINIIKVIKDTSSALFVIKVFINWGKNAAVVNIAAKYPKNSMFIKTLLATYLGYESKRVAHII